MNTMIESTNQLAVMVESIFTTFKKYNFTVKVNSNGNIIGYLRPETGALYCAMSVSHFKYLLSSGQIPSKKISEKITLIRISDIDSYIEKMAEGNTK